jgi:glycerophosphoryl diester phosphodiesterase
VDLDLDLKLPGYEDRVVAALREHGLADRTLVSTMEPVSFPRIRALAPEVRLGWSVPRVRRNYLRHPATRPLALAAARTAAARCPGRLVRALRAGEVDAVMAHYVLVSPAFWRAIREAGGELYVWTVDDAREIARLESLGVTGIITNDPRLFG